MSGFDADRLYNVAIHDGPQPVAPDSPAETEKLLLEFLLQYRVGGEFIYRYALRFILVVGTHMRQGQITRKSIVKGLCS